MYLIDLLHRRGIGVVLHRSPARLAGVGDGPPRYDGGALLELVGPGGAWLFDHARPEVRAFLVSAACFWLDRFHADGLRLDGVEALTEPAEGTADSLHALEAAIRTGYPDVLLIRGRAVPCAPEPPPSRGGEAGRVFERDRGWARDILEALCQEAPTDDRLRPGPCPDRPAGCPLPFSHDEVSERQGYLIARLPRDDWQQRAGLRLLLGYPYACPGKKLLFMGGEFGQGAGWRLEHSLDWHLHEQPGHRGLITWARGGGPQTGWCRFFGWGAAPTISSLRSVICGPVRSTGSAWEPPRGGCWQEVLNSDAWMYGGSGRGNLGGADADPVPIGSRYRSLLLNPPRAASCFCAIRAGVRPQGQASAWTRVRT